MFKLISFTTSLAAIALVSSAHAQNAALDPGARPAPAAAPAPSAAAPGRPAPPANAQAGAPVDLTGQWVSVVTEDWRWRMVTPPKGDYASVPLTAEGRRVADGWNLAADDAAGNQCKAFGAGGLLRLPGRIRISWQDPNTLKLESDAGEQTRLYKFVQPGRGAIVPALTTPTASTERSWQGDVKAQWYKQPQFRGLGFGGAPGEGGALRAVTRNLKAGYLRKNGVPYSEDAVVTEQFNLFKSPTGETWLVVTTVVEDPKFLNVPFVTSTNFKKETGASAWRPSPCRTDPPVGKLVAAGEG